MQVPAQPLRPISEELPRPDLTEAEEGEGLPYAAADVENVSPPPQPRRIMAVQQPAAPPAARDKSEVYGLGITWMQRKGKLIISGFMPGSLARQSGCQIGDILRAVDDNEVVHFRPTANVRPDPHPPWTVHEVIVV
mmetsp:Transcript_3122/g.6303  ORF Transcript_3122/g.6303 Transcript_3122/m.6303 type:complete len:136 (-) Transcript_3122:435-842(-)